jgi:hypothetical protein
MATLTGNTIASTYAGLLSVDGAISTGAIEVVEDGAGTDTSLWLATERCQIKLGTDSGDDFNINDGSNNIVLVEGDTKDVTLLNDLILISDSSIIKMGAGADIKLTHDGGTGGTLSSSGALKIDSAANALTLDGHIGVTVQSSSSGDITLDSSTDIVLDAAGGNIEFKDAGVLQLSIDLDTTGGDIDIDLEVDGDDLVFNQYDGTEVMRITDTIRVGITENTPDVKLHLSDATAGAWGGIRLESTNTNGQTFIDFKGPDDGVYLDNPNGIRWLKGSDTEYMYIGQPYDDGQLTDDSFTIGSDTTENNSWVYIHAGDVRIGTQGDAVVDAKLHVIEAGDSVFTCRLENTDADNPRGLEINYSGGAPDGAGDDFIKCLDTGATRFQVHSSGDMTADTISINSDQRLKDNIVDCTSKLDDLNKLKVRNFNWRKKDSETDQIVHSDEKAGKKYIGLIAQEVESVFPSLVSDHIVVDAIKDEEGSVIQESLVRKTIKTSPIVPMLIKAVQELSAKNDDLTARIEVLESA